MWSLCRALIHSKNRGLSLCTSRICCGKSEMERHCLENNIGGCIELENKAFADPLLILSTKPYHSISRYSKSSCEVRPFCLSAKSSGKEEATTTTCGDENDDGLISESETSDEEDGVVVDIGENEIFPRNRGITSMAKAIDLTHSLVKKDLDKWVEQGNEVTRVEVLSTMLYLQKRHMYAKALQMSEWLLSRNHLEFEESDYATHVDLIAKVQGVLNAENYVEQQIPECFRGELVYRTLLANWASEWNVKKCEEVFNKMKKLGFRISCFSCNKLLLVYRRNCDTKKIEDILLLMEKENIKPSLFTYRILIDVKGKSNDIHGMEQIVETMKVEGLEPNVRIKASLARHYVNSSMKDKAEAVLKDMEGDDIMKNRGACKFMLPIYASLGLEDEVDRIWKVICKSSDPSFCDCVAAIKAWGQLNRVEKAEEAFYKIKRYMFCSSSSRHFTGLLKVYTDHKMFEKGQDLLKTMVDNGFGARSLTWDRLMKLYYDAAADGEEVEKPETTVIKMVAGGSRSPLTEKYFYSYIILPHFLRIST